MTVVTAVASTRVQSWQGRSAEGVGVWGGGVLFPTGNTPSPSGEEPGKV